MDEFFFNLIESVKQEPVLYDKTSSNYLNRYEKDNAWERIGNKLDKTKEECKKKWIILRDRFTKELRMMNLESKSSENNQPVWKYWSNMKFLIKFVKHRKTRTKIKLDESFIYDGGLPSAEYSSPTVPTPTPSPTPSSNAFKGKRKISESEVSDEFMKTIKIIRGEDSSSDMLFFQSMVDMMKILPENTKDDIKKKIFDIIYEERKKYISKNQ